MNKVRMGNDPKLKPFHFHDPAWQTFVMRGEGNFGARPRATKKGGDKGEVSFPPSSRALRASLASEIPFPFPFERLPRRPHFHIRTYSYLFSWLKHTYKLRDMASTRDMPCWWVLMRTKQLSMAASSGVIRLCARVRYWPYRGDGTCASVLKLVFLSPWR